MGEVIELFYADSEESLEALKAWAKSKGLRPEYEVLDYEVPHKSKGYSHQLTIHGIRAGDTGLFGSLDEFAENSGFQAGNLGSFKIKEDTDECGERFAEEKLFA